MGLDTGHSDTVTHHHTALYPPDLVRSHAGDLAHVQTPDGTVGGLPAEVGHVRPRVPLGEGADPGELGPGHLVALPGQQPRQDGDPRLLVRQRDVEPLDQPPPGSVIQLLGSVSGPHHQHLVTKDIFTTNTEEDPPSPRQSRWPRPAARGTPS